MISEKTLKTLEFDKVRVILSEFALTGGAKARALSITPSCNYNEIEKNLSKVNDAQRLLDAKGMPPFGDTPDITEIINRADKSAVLSPRDLLYIGELLRTVRLLIDYSKTDRTFDTTLDEIFARLMPNKTLENRIFDSIISEDLISDTASQELYDIRRKIKAANNRIKDSLQKYVSGQYGKYLQENIITQRDGRYVIPVRQEYKNEIKGIVHDTSASGATVFIEPMPVLEANNELRILESKEKAEIERILAEISAECATYGDIINRNYHNTTELAYNFTCADFARHYKARRAMLTNDRYMVINQARHPLISPQSVVPTNIRLGNDYDTLIITGPNTGGKTVALKTIGLFALMTQAGLPIPAGEGSTLCIFEKVLADIGDEQSIEQSLSTFSSHMVNVIDILKQITPKSLILFDELGAGTDPIEGAALAISIIEKVRSAGALSASTTHYAELKAYALESEGVQNASCEFDITTLRPTYKLVIGMPGKSNAFAISEKLGMDRDIIEAATEKVSSDSRQFELVIEKLENARVEMERQRDEALALKKEAETKLRESEEKIRREVNAANAEIKKATEKARQIITSAKASSDFVFKSLDEIKKKRESESFLSDLAKAKKAVKGRLSDADDDYSIEEIDPLDMSYVLPRPLKVGDNVYLVNFGQQGVVKSLTEKDGLILVDCGILKAKVDISKIRLLDGKYSPSTKANPKTKEKPKAPAKVVLAAANFKPEVDLRGMNIEEALPVLDKYIDDAFMAGMASVSIIHGKGTGVLRKAVREYLHSDKRIKSYRSGEYGEGDTGVTVITLSGS